MSTKTSEVSLTRMGMKKKILNLADTVEEMDSSVNKNLNLKQSGYKSGYNPGKPGHCENTKPLNNRYRGMRRNQCQRYRKHVCIINKRNFL